MHEYEMNIKMKIDTDTGMDIDTGIDTVMDIWIMSHRQANFEIGFLSNFFVVLLHNRLRAPKQYHRHILHCGLIP
jgi:hypothetical protein